ncbi:hypothetical protein AB0E00_13695 [Streptomyces sp. NPDC048110]|uniref:hypothetical protein n=1 Tax=Streptomyces sp. NPDC048110 TaxID=3155483 RepID=UPI0033EB82A0
MPASAAEPSTQSSAEIAWTETDGTEAGARALTLEEVKAKGLGRYVDAANYEEVAPERHDGNTLSAPPTPHKRPDTGSGAAPLATTCWEFWFGHGIDELYGKTDVTWCGDGGLNWVNYSAAVCWGDDADWALTYKYLGCELAEDFGHPKADEYWNVYDVWTQRSRRGQDSCQMSPAAPKRYLCWGRSWVTHEPHAGTHAVHRSHSLGGSASVSGYGLTSGLGVVCEEEGPPSEDWPS